MTGLILRAMQDEIERYEWTAIPTANPTAIIGPIPPAFINYPCIGILAPNSTEGPRGRAYADTIERFSWTLASILNVASVEDSYLTSVDWLKEARDLARTAVGGRWGVASVEATSVIGSSTDFTESPGPGGIQHLTIMTLNMEVKYREAV